MRYKKSHLICSIYLMLSSCLLSANHFAYGYLTDPGLEASWELVYHVSKRGGLKTLTRISVQPEFIGGMEIYRMKIIEETGLITEIRMAPDSLRPLLTHQLYEEDLVYAVNYGMDQAEVVVAENQAVKTREVIPKIFLRFLGLFTSEESLADNFILEGQALPVPNRKLLKTMRKYAREKALLPSEKGNTLRRVSLPKDIYAVQSLPFVLSGFPFASRDDITFHISYMPHLMVVWNMRARNLGEETVNRYRCISHNGGDKNNLVFIGISAQGTPIWINRYVAEAEYTIALGRICQHSSF